MSIKILTSTTGHLNSGNLLVNTLNLDSRLQQLCQTDTSSSTLSKATVQHDKIVEEVKNPEVLFVAT